MWLVCGRALLTLAILGVVTVLMYYAAERVHEVETTVVPLSVNESSRYEIHNRTVVRGSRSRRSSGAAAARKFDPFFGLFPAVGATEVLVAPSIAWDRPIGKRRDEVEDVEVAEVVKLAIDNEADDLSAEKIELPKSRAVANRKRKVRSALEQPPSLSITGDEDRSRQRLMVEDSGDAEVVIDIAGEPVLLVKTSLDSDVDDEMRLPQNALRSRMPLNRDLVGNMPKIDRNLFDTSEEDQEEEETGGRTVDQKTVTADHGTVDDDADDDLLEPQVPIADANIAQDEQQTRPRRKTEYFSREDVSYVFVPDCITKPDTRLSPPRKYPLPGGFMHQGGYRRPHTQDYRDQRNRNRLPQDHGKYSMYRIGGYLLLSCVSIFGVISSNGVDM